VIDRVAVPCVYSLLPGKTIDIYRRLIQAVKNRIPGWNPQRVMSDYESAVITVINDELPNINHSGCLFHFGQCLHRKLSESNEFPALRAMYADLQGGIFYIYFFLC
jgi:hypothetical protein